MLIIPGVGKQLLKWAPSFQTVSLSRQPQHLFKIQKPICMPQFSARGTSTHHQAGQLTFSWKWHSLRTSLPLRVGSLRSTWDMSSFICRWRCKKGTQITSIDLAETKPTQITEDQNIPAAYDQITSSISLKSEDERFLFDWLEGKMVGTLVSYTSTNTSLSEKTNSIYPGAKGSKNYWWETAISKGAPRCLQTGEQKFSRWGNENMLALKTRNCSFLSTPFCSVL